MTSREFVERLSRRAQHAGESVAAAVQQQFEEYFGLLTHWNAKINLTALPLGSPTDETFDRLLVEPLVAAKYIPDSARLWLDLGTGGGSPAIPSGSGAGRLRGLRRFGTALRRFWREVS